MNTREVRASVKDRSRRLTKRNFAFYDRDLYMRGTGPHPGRLLPWEELREDRDGLYYFFDLVTGDVTWRQPYDPSVITTPLFDRPDVGNLPPHLMYAPEEQKAAYHAQQERGIQMWRDYLAAHPERRDVPWEVTNPTVGNRERRLHAV